LHDGSPGYADHSAIRHQSLAETYNNLWGLISRLCDMNISMQTFLLRGVFEDIPIDLEEAAMIDGGSPWTIFTRIIIPIRAGTGGRGHQLIPVLVEDTPGPM